MTTQMLVNLTLFVGSANCRDTLMGKSLIDALLDKEKVVNIKFSSMPDLCVAFINMGMATVDHRFFQETLTEMFKGQHASCADVIKMMDVAANTQIAAPEFEMYLSNMANGDQRTDESLSSMAALLLKIKMKMWPFRVVSGIMKVMCQRLSTVDKPPLAFATIKTLLDVLECSSSVGQHFWSASAPIRSELLIHILRVSTVMPIVNQWNVNDLAVLMESFASAPKL